MKQPVLSLVFPAWNEAENLPDLLASALETGSQLGFAFEIVIVDDGSADASRALLEAWCRRDARIRSVHHAENQGYGAALRAGLKTARGEFVFFSDADLQFDLGEIRRLLDHTDEYEIVAGYRAPRRDPWLRRAIALVWNRLVGALFDLPVRDIDCAFKVFHRKVLEAIPIQSVGAFVNTEMLVRARAAGFRIKQVPVGHHRRRSGRQTGAHPRVIARALLELTQLYRSLHPRTGANGAGRRLPRPVEPRAASSVPSIGGPPVRSPAASSPVPSAGRPPAPTHTAPPATRPAGRPEAISAATSSHAPELGATSS